VIDDRLPEVLECIILGRAGDLPLPVAVTGDGSIDRSRWNDATRDLPPLAEPVVVTWDDIPRTATGKARRLELRERVAAGTATFGTGRWT
jgi:acyl-coenzyme A synthetase/AMP-(fatty) acid ligase